MKIQKKTHEALIEQDKLLMEVTDKPEDYVILFKDKEKLLIVLQNILDGKFVELLVEYRVMDYYVNKILKRKNRGSFEYCPISSLIDGTFTWYGTCQGVDFWYDVNNKFKSIIHQYYENKTK